MTNNIDTDQTALEFSNLFELLKQERSFRNKYLSKHSDWPPSEGALEYWKYLKITEKEEAVVTAFKAIKTVEG